MIESKGILKPPARYKLLARNQFKELLSIDENMFGSVYSGWIEEALKAEDYREPAWSESVAVGNKKFVEGIVEGIKEELGYKAVGRKIHEGVVAGASTLREPGASYGNDFSRGNEGLSEDNSLIWNIYPEISNC